MFKNEVPFLFIYFLIFVQVMSDFVSSCVVFFVFYAAISAMGLVVLRPCFP